MHRSALFPTAPELGETDAEPEGESRKRLSHKRPRDSASVPAGQRARIARPMHAGETAEEVQDPIHQH